MSVDGWKRRLAKRGLRLLYVEDHGFGYASECWLSKWTAIVAPTVPPEDPWESPLAGVGVHPERDQAIRLAVLRLEQTVEYRERERALRVLAQEVAC